MAPRSSERYRPVASTTTPPPLEGGAAVCANQSMQAGDEGRAAAEHDQDGHHDADDQAGPVRGRRYPRWSLAGAGRRTARGTLPGRALTGPGRRDGRTL